MAFFLVDRDRTSGSLRLLTSDVFSTREDALAALPGLISQQDSVERDFFVSDLGVATPVLFMAQPADEKVGPDAIATPDTTPVEEPAALEEPIAGVWETPADDVPADPGTHLADALRRAATSLESEGIVAPESIPPSVPDNDEASEQDELASAIASLGAQAPADDIVEPVSEEVTSTEWPWANVEQVAVGDETPEDEPLHELADTEEPLPVTEDEQSVETSEIDAVVSDESMIDQDTDSEGFVPRPVIMGDYGDVTPMAEVVATDEVDAAPPADLAEEPSDLPSEPAFTEEPSAVDTAPAVYEPGELELGEYTCDDCVYASTCPKAGSSNPAECGSFQWKS